MKVTICTTKDELAEKAARTGADKIREAINERRRARIILATGTSQIGVLKFLVGQTGIDWSKVEMFHLDEYVGISADHPASFRRFLKERFVDVVHPAHAWFIEGDSNELERRVAEVGKKLTQAPIDVAFVGIGENGHLAFNDPPADFTTRVPYLVLALDLACRMQQVGEGWFRTVDEVPPRAVSMSVRQILASKTIICSVPDRRKAEAVRDCLSRNAAVSPLHPASILKEHAGALVFLDKDSASLLEE